MAGNLFIDLPAFLIMAPLILSNLFLFLIIIILILNKEIRNLLFRERQVQPEKDDSVKKFEKANPKVPPHLLHFITGQKNAWSLARLAIYEMYRDGELLDYDSMVKTIMKRIENYSNQEYVDKICKELDLYTKEQERLNQCQNTGDSSLGEAGSTMKPESE